MPTNPDLARRFRCQAQTPNLLRAPWVTRCRRVGRHRVRLRKAFGLCGQYEAYFCAQHAAAYRAHRLVCFIVRHPNEERGVYP